MTRALSPSAVLGVLLLFGPATAQLMLMLLAQQLVWTGVGLGLTATLAGAIKLPSNFMGLIGAPWSGRIAARHGARRAALWGSLTFGAITICAVAGVAAALALPTRTVPVAFARTTPSA